MTEKSNERRVPVLYLDIDGTVRQGKDDDLGRFVNGPDDVHVFPEAVKLMRRWKNDGGRIIGITNQGGIALGIVDENLVMAGLVETQRQCMGMFDLISICKHHPNATDPEMARCWCRKPRAGLVVEAAIEMATRSKHTEIYPPHLGLFVGDRPEDEQCAANAGLDFMWAADWRATAR